MIKEEHKLAFIIGSELGTNKVITSNCSRQLPEAGHCTKHGYFTLSLENSEPYCKAAVIYSCPYCKLEEQQRIITA